MWRARLTINWVKLKAIADADQAIKLNRKMPMPGSRVAGPSIRSIQTQSRLPISLKRFNSSQSQFAPGAVAAASSTDEGRLDRRRCRRHKAIGWPRFLRTVGDTRRGAISKGSIGDRRLSATIGLDPKFLALIAPQRIWSYWKDPERALQDAGSCQDRSRVTFPDCIALT
jgi:hypothetical protein